LIAGISSSDYYARETSNRQALLSAIASCMAGINPGDIHDLHVKEAASSTARRLSSHMWSAAATATVNTTYEVIVDNTNGQYSYSTLSSELSSNVASGVFDHYLHTFAQEYAAYDWFNCTSTSVSTEDASPDATSSQSASSTDSSFSSGALAGVVIAAFIVLGCIIAAVYYFCMMTGGGRGAYSEKAVVADNDVEDHAAASNPISLRTVRPVEDASTAVDNRDL
jgi:hypothetical protein